jgi:type VI protein secretion system component VasK
MATSAVMDISIGDFKQAFQSSAELTKYIQERLVPKLEDAATEIWNSSTTRTRALGQDLTGELAGMWVDDQPFNGRSVDVGISVGIRI